MTTCSQCNAAVSPEDAAYDDRTGKYFCRRACFLDWADDNHEEITDFYIRLNVTD